MAEEKLICTKCGHPIYRNYEMPVLDFGKYYHSSCWVDLKSKPKGVSHGKT